MEKRSPTARYTKGFPIGPRFPIELRERRNALRFGVGRDQFDFVSAHPCHSVEVEAEAAIEDKRIRKRGRRIWRLNRVRRRRAGEGLGWFHSESSESLRSKYRVPMKGLDLDGSEVRADRFGTSTVGAAEPVVAARLVHRAAGELGILAQKTNCTGVAPRLESAKAELPERRATPASVHLRLARNHALHLLLAVGAAEPNLEPGRKEPRLGRALAPGVPSRETPIRANGTPILVGTRESAR